jgi:hypothetical protein
MNKEGGRDDEGREHSGEERREEMSGEMWRDEEINLEGLKDEWKEMKRAVKIEGMRKRSGNETWEGGEKRGEELGLMSILFKTEYCFPCCKKVVNFLNHFLLSSTRWSVRPIEAYPCRAEQAEQDGFQCSKEGWG